jgi:competence protein ComEA
MRARVRLSLGAGIVLVLAAAIVAVIVAAVTPHGVDKTVAPQTVIHTITPGATGGSGGEAGASAGGSAGGSTGASPAGPTVFVHIVGRVRAPGLYELAAGSRIVDAVAAAGGFAAQADQVSLNLAQVVSDGQQIVVAVRGAHPAAPGATTDGKVDINTADAAALETLDGIGPALAARILDFRKQKGGFSAVTDLQKVSGIGDKKFAAIKDSVTT